jgi:hypothetical protein
MTFQKKDEVDLFGAWAPALIPMFMIGQWIEPEQSEQVLHQADLAPTIAAALTPMGCGYPGWSNFLVEAPDPGRCVFHSLGSDWEKLMVYCPTAEGVIHLDGDDSRFLESSGLDSDAKKRLLRQVAYLRTLSQAHTQEYLDRSEADQ